MCLQIVFCVKNHLEGDLEVCGKLKAKSDQNENPMPGESGWLGWGRSRGE